MAAGVLYTYPENFRAYKALIAAQYSGVDLKVAPNFVFGETNKSEAFLKKFPAGKVPAYESADGKVLLTESNAIAYYVSSAALRGADAASQARVLQWMSWADSELLPASCAWVFPYLGIMPFNKQNVERAKNDLLAALQQLDAHLLTRTFLVGERVSLADVVVFATLLHAFQHVLEPSVRASLGNVSRWFSTLAHQPAVTRVLPPAPLCAAPPVYDPKKYAEISKKSGLRARRISSNDPKLAIMLLSRSHTHCGRASLGNVSRWFSTLAHQPAVTRVLPPAPLCAAPPVYDPKKYAEISKKDGGKKDKKAEKKEQKPQEPKKKAEAPPADDLELDEKPKESKDPFDAMPKGTFNMDDFKRCYSNEDEAKSIPYFWEKFDPENYSIWYAEYKYPEELAKVFMSCNLITGMFQRLDKMRKQAFASVCLFGDDNNSSISGVWVWRGHDLAFPLSPDWQIDYESYEWKKLDPASPETKRLVQDYFSWSGADKQGRKFNQGKIFK